MPEFTRLHECAPVRGSGPGFAVFARAGTDGAPTGAPRPADC